ncbi:MAG: DNA polymerase/3'-5' exonuclease PolX [Thermomicrobiales bacterium]
MTSPLSNADIAAQLQRHAALLEISGDNAFRARAFERAAESIRAWPESVARLAATGDLRSVPGIGEGIAAAIEQLLASGSFAAHTELTSRFPESLIEITGLSGVGAKTAQRLYAQLGITDLAALEAALVAGRIGATKGLGKRTEETIRAGIESLRQRTGRMPLGVALPVARALVEAYRSLNPKVTTSLAGSIRRWEDTVGDIDLVIATDDCAAVAAALASLSLVASASQVDRDAIRLNLAAGIEADVYCCRPESWGSTLVRATGSAAHLERLSSIFEAATEEEIYAANGLPWIPPELRAGGDEFAWWSEIPGLVQVEDIGGEFHAHSTWSDGGASILEMAEAALDWGYSFLGITDHSQGLGVANGLTPSRISAQREEIADAQRQLGDRLRLLAGSEVEVRRDGSLDFDDELLSRLDVVVASVHTGLRQPREELTSRLIGVLQNPHVDIIAHPSGRLIERRPGGDFDWDRVFASAASTGTALEINADPARLDLTAAHAMRASAAGAVITINCDAHSPSGFAVMEYGVAVARKAWLTPYQILNCWPRSQVLAWLAERRRS